MSPRLPPLPAQIAVILGFLIGTWTLVCGFEQLITGTPLTVLGHAGPWAGWGAGMVALGAAWMVAGNLYLFQNRLTSWKIITILVVVSSWNAGWAMLVLIAQLVLLLLPVTRRGLNAGSSSSGARA